MGPAGICDCNPLTYGQASSHRICLIISQHRFQLWNSTCCHWSRLEAQFILLQAPNVLLLTNNPAQANGDSPADAPAHATVKAFSCQGDAHTQGSHQVWPVLPGHLPVNSWHSSCWRSYAHLPPLRVARAPHPLPPPGQPTLLRSPLTSQPMTPRM